MAVGVPDASIQEVGELYEVDLPSVSLLTTEFHRWKHKFASVPAEMWPATLQL